MVLLDNHSTTEDKIKLANNSQDKKIQNDLANSYDVNIRRALAKNPYLDPSIANKLVFDPNSNVSYHASRNSNCTQKRTFNQELLVNKSIIREIDELN